MLPAFVIPSGFKPETSPTTVGVLYSVELRKHKTFSKRGLLSDPVRIQT